MKDWKKELDHIGISLFLLPLVPVYKSTLELVTMDGVSGDSVILMKG